MRRQWVKLRYQLIWISWEQELWIFLEFTKWKLINADRRWQLNCFRHRPRLYQQQNYYTCVPNMSSARQPPRSEYSPLAFLTGFTLRAKILQFLNKWKGVPMELLRCFWMFDINLIKYPPIIRQKNEVTWRVFLYSVTSMGFSYELNYIQAWPQIKNAASLVFLHSTLEKLSHSVIFPLC